MIGPEIEHGRQVRFPCSVSFLHRLAGWLVDHRKCFTNQMTDQPDCDGAQLFMECGRAGDSARRLAMPDDSKHDDFIFSRS